MYLFSLLWDFLFDYFYDFLIMVFRDNDGYVGVCKSESNFCVLCLTVTRSSILEHWPVGMGGEGMYKHMHGSTFCGK